MFYIYILFSKSSDVYYVGYSNDVLRRLIEHNTALHLTYTSKHRPWVLKAAFECSHVEAEAIKVERFIKKQKSRGLIEKMILGTPLTGILSQLVRVPYVRDGSSPEGGAYK